VSTLVRYWGSHLKSLSAAGRLAADFLAPLSEGWRVVLVCSRPPAEAGWAARLEELGVEIVYHPRPAGSLDAACVRRAYRLCRDTGCDAFHCDNMHTSPLLGAALAGVPVRLWSKRSMSPAYEAGREPTLRDRAAFSVRLSSLLATRVLAVSRTVKEELVSLGIPAGRILVLPNPLVKRGAPGVGRGEARGRLGYDEGDVVFLAVGHAVPVKGWDLLIEAFSRLGPSAERGRLLLVGGIDGAAERDHHASLLRLAGEKGVADRIRFTGHLPDLSDPFAAADLFVLPSRSEGYSIALAEAMGHGLPCVSTRVGIAPEVVVPGENGLLVERNDAAALAGALEAVLADPSLLPRLAGGARRGDRFVREEDHSRRLLAICKGLE
jgi:glycosyltransferase involved in cell wall biosynthesis